MILQRTSSIWPSQRREGLEVGCLTYRRAARVQGVWESALSVAEELCSLLLRLCPTKLILSNYLALIIFNTSRVALLNASMERSVKKQ